MTESPAGIGVREHRHRVSTLVDVCRAHAETQPEATAYAWLDDREIETHRMTYADLDRRARGIAAWLIDAVPVATPVLLLYEPGLEFIAAFLGCSYAGRIAVPAHPPGKRDGTERIARIVADCDAGAVLTGSPLHDRLGAAFSDDPALARLPIVATDALARTEPPPWTPPGITEDSIAFLQYTSGSTGVPKGVEVSHRNILANQRMIEQAFGHSASTVFAGWLPLHHDMGLIGNVLQPLYLGIPSILMAPETFIQKPVRWLRAISRYRATTSGAPDFAYELCTRRVNEADLAGLDLSSWLVAFNGAEPIRAQTVSRFTERFGPCGFRRETMFPSYGMAEVTLFATGGPAHKAPDMLDVDARALELGRVECSGDAGGDRRTLVACGRSWLDARVVIVDPVTCIPRGEQEIGEIWISGPHVSRGYLRQSELNRETFACRLPDGSGPFVRTGDVGFLRSDALFVTGRRKELIIVGGRNHYPHDIEATVAASHPAFRASGTIALSLCTDGGERLAIVQEIDSMYQATIDAGDDAIHTEMLFAMRRAVIDRHGITVHRCVFVRPGELPRTSSGKLRRRACERLFGDDGRKVSGNAWLDTDA